MFNRQEAFDKAAKGVIEQGQPAFDETRQGCAYRVPGTSLKCGVGHMIPDDLYSLDAMENCSIGSVDGVYGERSRNIHQAIGASAEDRPFLERVQHAHDGAYPATFVHSFVHSFYSGMTKVAFDYGLSLDVLDQAYADHCTKQEQQALAA